MRHHRLGTAMLTLLAVLTAGLVSLPSISREAVATADTATSATSSAGMFVPASDRLLDTRNGTGGYATPMPANTVRTVAAAGVLGIPSSDVSAVALAQQPGQTACLNLLSDPVFDSGS